MTHHLSGNPEHTDSAEPISRPNTDILSMPQQDYENEDLPPTEDEKDAEESDEDTSRFKLLWVLLAFPHLLIACGILSSYLSYESPRSGSVSGMGNLVYIFIWPFFIPSASYLLSFIHWTLSALGVLVCALVPLIIVIFVLAELDMTVLVPALVPIIFYGASAVVLFYHFKAKELQNDKAWENQRDARG